MCRPRSQIDEEETPIVPVSQVMSPDKAFQILGESQQPNCDENNKQFLVDGALDFDFPSNPEKISPVAISSVDFPRSVPNHTKSRNREATATLTSKRNVEMDKNGKIRRPIIVVQHDYHDYSQEEEIKHPLMQPKSRGGVSVPFPQKLHIMLDKAMAEGYGDIVSWQPHGRCFVVYKSKEFQDIVLPKYFKLSKLSSFQRQLNLYGFQRLTFGRDRGGYYHERFLRHKKFLAHGIRRVQVKGTGVRARSNPDQEPNFWTMTWCDPVIITKKSKNTHREAKSKMDNGGIEIVPSRWNASISHQSRSKTEQEQSCIWTMELNDPKIELGSSSGKNGRKCPRTADDSNRGVRLSTPQDVFNSCQDPAFTEEEPIDIRSMEWCGSKGTSSSNRHTTNTASYNTGNRGMPSAWNDALISCERSRSHQSMVTLPKEFQPIQTKTRQDPPLVLLRDVSPHHSMNLSWQNGSYRNDPSAEENGNLLVTSFGDKAFQSIDSIQNISEEQHHTNSSSAGGLTKNSLFSRTFGHQI